MNIYPEKSITKVIQNQPLSDVLNKKVDKYQNIKKTKNSNCLGAFCK